MDKMDLVLALLHTLMDREVLRNWRLSLKNTVIDEMLTLSKSWFFVFF